MATNDFKPFATGAGANVTAQAEWASLPALFTGFQSGKASSAQVNKAIRQASFISAALAQYVANKTGQDVLDDGDMTGFITKLVSGLGKDFQPADATLTNLSGKSVAGLLTYLGLGEGSALPAGVPVPWPSAMPPTGWLKCNGAAFIASQYPKLAQAYPALRLPDLRGEFIRGWDDGRGVDGGRGLLTFQEGTIVSGFDDNDTGDISSIGSPVYGFGDSLTAGQMAQIKGHSWIFDTASKGGQRYEWLAYLSARPRNIAFNYIVRAA